MTPARKCTARLFIAGSTFVATLVIVHECCKQLILGIDYLREYGAVIDIRDRSVTFAIGSDTATDEEHQPLHFRVPDDDVIRLPRSCSLASVYYEILQNGTGIAEHIKELGFTSGISVARAVITVIEGCAELLLTNFSREGRHRVKGTAIAYFDELVQTEYCHLVEEAAVSTSLH